MCDQSRRCAMGRSTKRPNYIQRRCVVCAQPTARTLALIPDEPDAPKILLCARHQAFVERMGVALAFASFDSLALYALAYGYEFANYVLVWKKPH